MAKSLEERIKEAIRLQFQEPAPPPPPRRITITVPVDVYEDVHELAKGIGESWSFTASLLLREAVDCGLRSLQELGYRMTGGEGIHPNKAKELLLNPEMADQDPEMYAQARALQAMGVLLPEIPPEDTSTVRNALSRWSGWHDLSAERQAEVLAQVERGESVWEHGILHIRGERS